MSEQLAAWVREKWGEGRACPYCGGREWAVGSSPLGGAVSCKNCGVVALIGVLPQRSAAAEGSGPADPAAA